MLFSAITNIILDPIFIFGFGWGIKGAALATAIAQVIPGFWILYYFMSSESLLKLRIKYFVLRLSIIRRIMVIGLAPFAMHVASSAFFIVLNRQLGTYGGDIAVSIMGIIFSVNMLIILPVIGVSQGANPIIGYNFGAKQYDRVRQTLKLGLITGSVITTLGFLVLELFPHQIISIFNNGDEDLAVMGPHAIRIASLMFPIIGFQIINANYFQAVGKAVPAIVLSLARQVLILIPLVLIMPRFYGLDGIWISMPISDFLASLITGTWLFIELRSLKTISSENNNFNIS